MNAVDQSVDKMKTLPWMGRQVRNTRRDDKPRWNISKITYPNSRLGGPIHQLLKGRFIQLVRKGRMQHPWTYSVAIGPSVQTQVKLVRFDQRGFSRLSMSSRDNSGIYEMKYRSFPARSSTSHKSLTVRGQSGDFAASASSFPLSRWALSDVLGGGPLQALGDCHLRLLLWWFASSSVRTLLAPMFGTLLGRLNGDFGERWLYRSAHNKTRQLLHLHEIKQICKTRARGQSV
ncbi:hypothetical protein B296_00056012 [Ensete ventricosum]|uniref:Uncharacterized protein n=1 Tax=Ensete ventricosum TaxID=4639 RepID=A0A426XMJ6_ENSVE|nr:hypothetical protein B296_00056012 [Ensete ventricosum]